MRKVLILLMLLVVAGSAQTLTSGLQKGENTPPHHPNHVTGPDAGSDVCPV